MKTKLIDILTEDSVICLKNGTVVKGAKEVANVIDNCCELYNYVYIQTMKKELTKGFIIGGLLTIAIVGSYELYKKAKHQEEK